MFLVSVGGSEPAIDNEPFVHVARVYISATDQTVKSYEGVYATTDPRLIIDGRLINMNSYDLNLGKLCDKDVKRNCVTVQPAVYIALVERGDCTVREKMKNLQKFNLSIVAVIFYNDKYFDPFDIKTIQGQLGKGKFIILLAFI